MFTYSSGTNFLALLVYVDDVINTGTSNILIADVKHFLHDIFSINNLGHLHYFVGIEVARSKTGLFLNQRKYTLDIIHEAGLSG